MQQSSKNKGYLYALMWGAALAVLLIMPAIIRGEGILYLTNDFSTQQHPFYVLCHNAIKSGSLFSSLTGLGAGLIGSYSFYTLGSPFFLFTLLFPSSALPYLMGPLMIVKISLSTLTAYIYLRPYVKDYRYVLLGSILYAFSGYQLFNIFYNHFEDVCVFAPLLLWSLDRLMEDKKRGAFMICVFINALVNYIFFVGSVVFVVIYFIIKVATKEYKLTGKRMLRIIVESVLGFAASFALVLPALLTLLGNSRLSSSISGIDTVIYYSEPKHYLEIIRALFFPSDTPHIEPFFAKNASIRWTSPSVYLPFFGVTGIIAGFMNRGQKFYKIINTVILIFMFVPVLNSIFCLFNSAYYARWFYFPALVFSLGTIISLDKAEHSLKTIERSATVNLSVTVVLSLIALFFPTTDSSGNIKIGLFKDIDIYFTVFYVALAIASQIIIIIIFRHFKSKTAILKTVYISVSAAVILIGTVNINMMCSCYPDSQNYKERFIDGNSFLNDGDDSYRIDTTSIHYNVHMWWNKSSLATFNSTINPYEIGFYETIGYSRYVATMPNDSYYALRYLTSVRYAYYDSEDECMLPGFHAIGKQNGYYVYENTNYIPMGFTYLNYISYDDFNMLRNSYKDNMLLKAILLDDSQIAKYSKYLGKISVEKIDELFSVYESIEYDAEVLRAHAGYYFKWNDNGFTSKINLRTDNLVFYSVPYDKGFKAYVNGVETEVECVNGGLMAVLAPAGDNTIEFVYTPVGLKEGITVSGISIAAAVIYLSAAYVFSKRHQKNEAKK